MIHSFGPCSIVQLECDHAKTIKELSDTDFDIVLLTQEGEKIVLSVSGGNGGAYGANLDVIREADQ